MSFGSMNNITLGFKIQDIENTMFKGDNAQFAGDDGVYDSEELDNLKDHLQGQFTDLEKPDKSEGSEAIKAYQKQRGQLKKQMRLLKLINENQSTLANVDGEAGISFADLAEAAKKAGKANELGKNDIKKIVHGGPSNAKKDNFGVNDLSHFLFDANQGISGLDREYDSQEIQELQLEIEADLETLNSFETDPPFSALGGNSSFGTGYPVNDEMRALAEKYGVEINSETTTISDKTYNELKVAIEEKQNAITMVQNNFETIAATSGDTNTLSILDIMNTAQNAGSALELSQADIPPTTSTDAKTDDFDLAEINTTLFTTHADKAGSDNEFDQAELSQVLLAEMTSLSSVEAGSSEHSQIQTRINYLTMMLSNFANVADANGSQDTISSADLVMTALNDGNIAFSLADVV